MGNSYGIAHGCLDPDPGFKCPLISINFFLGMMPLFMIRFHLAPNFIDIYQFWTLILPELFKFRSTPGSSYFLHSFTEFLFMGIYKFQFFNPLLSQPRGKNYSGRPSHQFPLFVRPAFGIVKIPPGGILAECSG